ncbi:MAG: ATP-grasp domain-containing protein [Gemmatimonadetes bacterium]|nr:ATP-grasp domain-containing protein [Gemmatimonadota bacterium]
MNVLFIAPGYPAEMPYYVRGLRAHGATVFGLGDQQPHELPPMARENLADYGRFPGIFADDADLAPVKAWLGTRRVDRVVCQWEPGVLLCGRLRDYLGVVWMGYEALLPFRDKAIMKEKIRAAGLRTARSERANSAQQVRDAAATVGYPLIVKPIAGAGSMDTFRCNDAAELEAAIGKLKHIDEVAVEEFIEGEEYTFDTICHEGEVLFWNMCVYRPRPLIARTVEWISPQTMVLRDVDNPRYASGKQLGFDVLKALQFRTGFTHMEWYRLPSGEAVFGEIGARPPGAHTVDIMNWANDIDLFLGMGEAELKGTLSQPLERKYNCTCLTKRAQGQGIIRRIDGVEKVRRALGDQLVAVNLLNVGEHRRDWKLTLLGDGWVVIRDPDVQACMDASDFVGQTIQMYATP